MIVCPNCNHQNPEGAIQCEACYTPLPQMISCPSCGTSVQSDASFCGQCGFNLKTMAATSENAEPSAKAAADLDIPDLPLPDPLIQPEPLATPNVVASVPDADEGAMPTPGSPPLPAATPSPGASESPSSTTQLQQQMARLLHVQTNTLVELPQHLSLVHMGKPNDRVPPDIDVSGFPNSEIVSRIHADIRVEGDIYYIEDVGSSNGTYVNNLPLPIGNRHRLRPGDRIALGKGDKVSFIFQLV